MMSGAPTLTIGQPAKGIIHRPFQFFGSAINRLANGLSFIRDRDRLMTLHARFDHATFVRASAFPAVLVAEMDFDAGNTFREMAERACHHRFGLLFQLTADLNVVICIDLDFHKFVFGWDGFIAIRTKVRTQITAARAGFAMGESPPSTG
jgi:hypothetical protein